MSLPRPRFHHPPPPDPDDELPPGFVQPQRFVREPLDDWTDGQGPQTALSRIMFTLAIVFVVAAIFFVAHVTLTAP